MTEEIWEALFAVPILVDVISSVHFRIINRSQTKSGPSFPELTSRVPSDEKTRAGIVSS